MNKKLTHIIKEFFYILLGGLAIASIPLIAIIVGFYNL